MPTTTNTRIRQVLGAAYVEKAGSQAAGAIHHHPFENKNTHKVPACLATYDTDDDYNNDDDDEDDDDGNDDMPLRILYDSHLCRKGVRGKGL